MDRICDYCDAQFDDSLDTCPHCGAANDFVRRGVGVPRTIEELKQYYIQHKFPSKEITRFFIDEDYRGPKAFGIYKDGNGDFVVYKNKADGSRAIRYQGTDESYAVNEIYLKLKEELAAQSSRRTSNRPTQTYNTNTNKQPNKNKKWIIIGIVIVCLIIAYFYKGSPSKGYYNVDGQDYYYIGNDWYEYDNDSWNPVSKPYFENNYNDYYIGNSYNSNSGYSSFDDSPYYDNYTGSVNDNDGWWDNDDNDNDYGGWDDDYDGGGWDSGGDWDSDW